MLKNYLIIAWRNFWSNKILSLINVIGLSIGISAALVIYLIVHYEFSFDRFEKDKDRIYRVVSDFQFSGSSLSSAAVPSPLGEAISKDVTGIESIAEFQLNEDAIVAITKNSTAERVIFKHQSGIIFSDEQYLKLLPYKWVSGTVETALKEPFKVVLSLQKAKKYFPGKDIGEIIGQKIIYNDSVITTVSGVVEDLDEQTDFHFNEFISLATIPNSRLKDNYSWGNWHGFNLGTQLFIKLSPATTPNNIELQLISLLKKYNKEANKDSKNTMAFSLQPLGDLHFNGVYGTFGDHTAHKPTLYGLMVIAIILLLLGCINFINLTTAYSSQRAREIGIRKTMGGSARQLMLQFLNETFLVTIISTLLSVALTPFLLKIFANFIPKGIHYNILHRPDLFFFLVGLIIIVGFLAGFYPSLILSRFNPALILKNQVYAGASGTRKAWLRKGLTILQFFIAQFFIIGTIVTVKQLHFIVNKDLGVKKDAIILLSVRSDFNDPANSNSKKLVLFNELRSIPGIQAMSLGSQSPSSSDFPSIGITYRDGKKEIEADVLQIYGDTGYINLYNIKVLAGRLPYHSDTTREFLINETYMHILGFQDPRGVLGKNILGLPVVGVMKDFNQESLHSPIKPLLFSVSTNNCYTFHIALKTLDAWGTAWQTTIGNIKTAYKKIYPDDDFSCTFFSESIARFYKSEQDISSLLKWATGLAVLISCMGLLGLVIYTTKVRTKEIGVRKVLGASVPQIVSVLSKDFITLVFIAFLIAAPSAWWATYLWLENFAYKTKVSWWVFLLSGASMTLIALLTLSIQTIRAANANPVKSLRTE
ncbi:ABC transporter permease [Flavitalea sp. BT771]|uniref:ABC transporter permease n=1 Tax=Flavitalea sp. BT771 TaxID=3063329 RepID=UPI0026E1A9E9|nr:ABC transporter permease [Flavitalea sp. BT771]MDO6432309.1 ABC transporter permease [Flavitalea sp. BT771]MDV6221219.1 FtsX-like permease family protein [Flavitalea sp. BT771]